MDIDHHCQIENHYEIVGAKFSSYLNEYMAILILNKCNNRLTAYVICYFDDLNNLDFSQRISLTLEEAQEIFPEHFLTHANYCDVERTFS